MLQVLQEAESLKAEANKMYVAGQYSEALVGLVFECLDL